MRAVLRFLARIACAVLLASALYVATSVACVTLREREDPLVSAPRDGRFVDAGGVRVFARMYAGKPDRTAVLLVHGTGAWSGTWFDLIPALQRAGYPVVAVDLPPFGYSDKSTVIDFSRAAQAERLRAVLDALHVRRVVVVGHSFGGGPALEFALRAPDRTARLVLVDAALGLTASPPDAASMACRVLAMPTLRHVLIDATAANPLWSGALLRRFVARKDAVTAQRLASYREPARLAGASAALGAWANHFACARETGASMDSARIQALAVPTFLLWGADDTITPLAQAEHLRGLLPKAPLRTMEGVGHIPHIEAPAAFEHLLLETLAASDPH